MIGFFVVFLVELHHVRFSDSELVSTAHVTPAHKEANSLRDVRGGKNENGQIAYPEVLLYPFTLKLQV